MDLGVTSLTLDVGESYTFTVTFDPEDPVIRNLIWFNTDASVIRVNEKTNTVTALKPGTARLMAESFDKTAFALCDITVSGAQGKDSAGLIDGINMVTLSDAERGKIDATRIRRYLDLLETSVFSEASLQGILDREMRVTAKVNPGTEEAESERALALGMTEAVPMKKLNFVSLTGTLSEILEFVKENDDLIRIFELPVFYNFPDPEPEEPSSQPKTVQGSLMLQDHVEILSSVSTIQNMGLTGKGTTIAVIDIGLYKDHEQFGGRVIAENCFNKGSVKVEINECKACVQDDPDCVNPHDCQLCTDGADCKIVNSCKACDPEDKECTSRCYYYIKEHYVCDNNGGSAYPGNAFFLDSYDHGSHVTGVAAGEDGMAPNANIVAVNVQSEVFDPKYITDDNPQGYELPMELEDILQALNWLLEIQDELKKEGKPISIVNMSLGGDAFETACDTASDYSEFFEVFQKLNDAGMIPVAAAGNEGMYGKIAFPACMSNVMTVGALAGMDEPMIVSFSNHSELVDIVAPGTELYSAFLVNMDYLGNTTCTENCYGYLSGTSQATPVVSGSLALLSQAFPGKTIEEYKTMLKDISTKTVDRRNSIDLYNYTSDDMTGTWFHFVKPILDFSGLKEIPAGGSNLLVIDDGMNGKPVIKGEISTTVEDVTAVKAEIIKDGSKVSVSVEDVNASGAGSNGIDTVNLSNNGELTLTVRENITAGNAGIVIHEENKGPLDILVPGTVFGQRVGILVNSDSVRQVLINKGGEGYPDNITITVGEIIPNRAGNVAEDAEGNKVSEIEDAINYIIYVDQPENGMILVVDGNGDPWTQQNHGYNTAKKGQTVYFKPSEDIRILNRKTGLPLPCTADGLFYTVVGNGGPVHVFAGSLPEPEPHKIELFRITENFGASGMPKTGFSAIRPQNLSEQPLRAQYRPTSLTIQLPKLDVESDIVTVPFTDGAYPVEWLGSAVGMLEGSSLPGGGITVLTGHNHLNTTEAGPFALLRELEAGDIIMITDQRGNMQTWHVYKSEKIPADRFAGIADAVKENALVLITCEDESVGGGYLNRRVVLAEQ